MSDNRTQRPIPLVRNVRYPTYQLWAIAGDIKNQENVMKICILQTMQWLRERFREHDLPKEMDYPTADAYAEVDFSLFTNIRLKHGYQLEIVWLSEEKSWSLQLTEPDLGSNPGKRRQTRTPAAGRLFETNISYQLTGKGVLCGFLTMVSEPEGTTKPCEVYRLGVIKNLKRNPLVGLQQIWELKEEPHYLDSSADVRRFAKKAKMIERTLPAVVISEHVPASTSSRSIDPGTAAKLPEQMPDLEKLLTPGYARYRSALGNTMDFPKKDEDEWQANPVLPDWLPRISHDRMGYAHLFVVAAPNTGAFNSVTGYKLPDGGLLIIPPPQAREQESSFPYTVVSGDDFHHFLDDAIQNYAKEKQFDFTHCCFVPQAQEIQAEKMLNDIHTEVELRTLYAEKLARLEEQDSKKIAEIEGEHRRDCRKLEQELARAKSQQKNAEDNLKHQQTRLLQLNNEVSTLVSRLGITKSRPAKLSGVCEWAAQHYGSRLLIHDRAQRMMKDIQNEVDISLLCDSLEYLANEYWDMLNGNIDEQERQRLCFLYYNRPFEVVANSDRSMRDYPNDYSIAHRKGNAQLTQHLKVGKDPMRLVRIYFFYDRADQKIVVGSMPKHLPIASYK